MALFQEQPKGPGGVPLMLFLRPASLLVACGGPLYCTPSASLEHKNSISSGHAQTLTDPTGLPLLSSVQN